MKPEHDAQRPRLIAEMFNELHAQHHGGTSAPNPKPWETDKIRALMNNGVTFHELKAGLRWLFCTEKGRESKWLTPEHGISTIGGFVNAWDAIAIRVDKDMGAWRAGSGPHAASKRPGDIQAATGQKALTADQQEASRRAGLAAAGEHDERPSDDNRQMYRGPDTARRALRAVQEGDTE